MPGTQTNFLWLYALLSILALCAINDRTILLTFKSVSESFNWNVFFSMSLVNTTSFETFLSQPNWQGFSSFNGIQTSNHIIQLVFPCVVLCLHSFIAGYLYLLREQWLNVLRISEWSSSVRGTLFQFTLLLWSFMFSRHDCPRIVSVHASEDS